MAAIKSIKTVENQTFTIHDYRIGGSGDSTLIKIEIKDTNYLIIRKASETGKVTVLKLT